MNLDERIVQLRALLARVRSRARPLDALSAAPLPSRGPQPSPEPDPEPEAPSPWTLAPPFSPTIEPPRPRHTPRPEFPASLFVARTNGGNGGNVEKTSALGRTLSELLGERPPAPFLPAEEPPLPPAPPPSDDIPPLDVVELEVDSYPSGERERDEPDEARGVMSVAPVTPTKESAVLPGEERLESRSRLVSAPPVSPPLDAEPDEFARPISDPTLRAARPLAAAAAAAEPEASPSEPSRRDDADVDEDEDEDTGAGKDRAPNSSRRPISMEEKMNEAEDDGFHAAPPESGRLPAAPSFDLTLEPSRPAGPPPSEPTRPGGAAPIELPPPPPLASEAAAGSPLREAPVAAFVGEPGPAPPPKTFGELLDDALSL